MRIEDIYTSVDAAVRQMESAFESISLGDEDEWPALRKLRTTAEQLKLMVERRSTAAHNVMRFDVRLGHVYPMVCDGDIDIKSLVGKVQAAIIGENGRPRRFPKEWIAAFMPGA